MEWLYNLGVLQFSQGDMTNYVRLSPSLVWVHGFVASKLPTTNARNTLTKFVEDGIASNVVFGHTHRPSVVEGSAIGLNGVYAVNAPCMRKATDVNWMTLGFAEKWRLGFVICYFNPENRQFRYEMVLFEEQNEGLSAYCNGKEYSV